MIRDKDLYSRPETWVAWSINWGAIWVGALAALSAALIFGLLGTALGATSVEKISSWHTISMIEVIFIVCAAFFSFVIGGWVAGKITGARHSEPTILHATIAWLIATPILVTMLAAGAGTAFGGWYGGLIVSPIGAVAAAPASPDIVRNTAVAAVTSLLLGLIGSVIGGWMASGEPMTFTFHRKRNAYLEAQKGKVAV
jgi:bacteriorhodopsin